MSLNQSMPTSIATSDNPSARWEKQDTVWMLSLYGTAIGAGALFLPINAGLHGIWPLIIMALLAFPLTFYPHRALCRFVLSGTGADNSMTGVVQEHFGKTWGKMLTALYFFTTYPFLLMYSVALTNTVEHFMTHQMQISAPPRMLLALMLVSGLMTIVRFGQHVIVTCMSYLVYPFITILLLLSLYLIPHWNNALFTQQQASGSGMLMTLWLILPVMVFSFNHSPIISAFAVKQKERYGAHAAQRSLQVLKYSHAIMVLSVMFFVFSCVLSLSPADLLLAKQQNISILSYLANHFNTPLLAFIAPLVAFTAIAKSFLGHYLGAKESLHGAIKNIPHVAQGRVSQRFVKYGIELFVMLTCWTAATINPNILKMIETLGGPMIAILLFLMPMYAILKVPAMQKYGNQLSNWFVTVMGLITLSALVYGFIA